MELPKLPTVKDLVPYLVVAIVTFAGSMWARLGDVGEKCDKRVENALLMAERVWKEKFDQQQAVNERNQTRIDSADAKIERLITRQAETYKQYFERSRLKTK